MQGNGKEKIMKEWLTVWKLTDYVNVPFIPLLSIELKTTSKKWTLRIGEIVVRKSPEEILKTAKQAVEFVYLTVRNYDPTLKKSFMEAKDSLTAIQERRKENYDN